MLRPRILLLDAYDSFSRNIVALVEQQLGADVSVIVTDDERYWEQPPQTFLDYLEDFDAVIAGPGPGSPECEADLGLIGRLWTLPQKSELPILGICLGFQSLALTYGARIKQLKEPRHGLTAKVEHRGTSIFTGCRDVRVTQYNSLQVVLGSEYDNAISPWDQVGVLQPLGWVLNDAENGPICMALRHVSKPLFGVQFHPESVCTNHEGANVILAWWNEVQAQIVIRQARRSVHERSMPIDSSLKTAHSSATRVSHALGHGGSEVSWVSFGFSNITVKSIFDALARIGMSSCVLESGTRSDQTPVNPETGRFSILAPISLRQHERVEYYSATKTILHHKDDSTVQQLTEKPDLWSYLKDIVRDRKADHGPQESPFWGGLIGFVSYEACLESIGILSGDDGSQKPDCIFVFAFRSIVIDHVQSRVFIQSTILGDSTWLQATERMLRALDSAVNHRLPTLPHRRSSRNDSGVSLRKLVEDKTIRQPFRRDYTDKVRYCQQEIRAGNSYEICLTDQTWLKPETDESDWQTYCRLQEVNPAPFSAFFQLDSEQHKVSVIGSSPERFMSWSREGHCQFRPIKGTVKKGPGVTKQHAESILSSPKEQAENLMIVDLIRHDLHGVVGSGNVIVSKLMSVEEYETVFQLVSVIEGELPPGCDKSGIDVLASSLPPGSMTGAPKKRSCELLQQIEGHMPRGIYSGVLGYLDVGGGGDFSVVIRTAFKWTHRDHSDGDICEDQGLGVWQVGAGGAITVQSTIVGEWEEMEAKRAALLQVLGATAS